MNTPGLVKINWNTTTLGVSIAIMVTALVVIAGWYLHIHAAVQIFPGIVAMQYNTALCFLTLGLAGIGLYTQQRLLLAVGGIIAAVMGAAVILEYLSGVSSGLDTLFFDPWERDLSAAPGRMALTTAIGFFLTGSSLAVLAACRGAHALLGLANAITVSLALTSLVGYAYRITYVLPLRLGTQMALHTSTGFFAFGIAMLGYAWTGAERGPNGLPKWSVWAGVALLPSLLVGADAVFPEHSWPAVVMKALIPIAGVALITLAIRGLTSAKVAYKGLLMVAVPLVLLLIFAGLVAHFKRQSESAQSWALQSNDVIDTSRSLLMDITEAESAVRGYLITGNESFLDAYSRAARQVAPTFSQLSTLVGDSPVQEANANRLGQLTEEKMQRLAFTVDLIRNGNAQQATERIKEGTGPALMSRLRTEFTLFSEEEERLGNQRRRALDAYWQELSWVLVSGTAAAILLSAILTALFSGGIVRRLQRLRDNAIGLSVGDVLAAPLGGHDEIAELDRVFHSMAESLAIARRREQAMRVLEMREVDLRHTEALQKTQTLQSAIFSSARFSIIATDAQGVIQIFNAGAERMLGYSGAEVTNQMTPADFHDRQQLIARTAELSLESGTRIEPGFESLIFKAARGLEDIYEVTKVRKDGSRFPAIVSVMALRDTQDAIIGYLFLGTDNTARKEVELAQALLDQTLRDQQFYTRSLIESNIDALMMTDLKGIITDVNQQMMVLTGRAREELIGMPCKNFFTEPARAEAAIKRVLSKKKLSNYELTVRARNGHETLVSYNVATFHNRDQEVQGVIAAARDMTELKRFERTLQEKNLELQRANRMKSEFLATMSHELRTPLNAIIGFSEALLDGLMGSMSDQQREYVGDILTSGQHLLSLINDILDLSKVEAGMMTLEMEEVDLKSLLSNSLSIVREKAAALHIALELDAGEDLRMLQLDKRKTRQIVYNLLSNAVKFSACVPAGRVILSARRVSRSSVGRLGGTWPIHGFPLADNEFGEFIEISVRDNGIGISMANVAKLFKAFSQIDSSLTRRFEGTGLGLAMVKQLAELHGGTVALASAEGEGACFAVWLPLRPSAAAVENPLQRTS